jgi:hypothetical protein
LGAAATLIAAVIGFIAVRRHQSSGTQPDATNADAMQPSRPPEGSAPPDVDQPPAADSTEVTAVLTIDDDGSFVGGDEEQATDLVVALLDVPKGRRRVQVNARALADDGYRRRRPDAYVRLRDGVRSYERALNLLFEGGVYYYQQWQESSDLAQAVLELRRIALPAQYDREQWYVWPAVEAEAVLTVRLTEEDAASIRSGRYRTVRTAGGEKGIPGIPDEEPVWLRSIWPRIVWRRIVPAVAAAQAQRGAQAGEVVDLSDWVISDRLPSALARQRPGEPFGGGAPPTWSW